MPTAYDKDPETDPNRIVEWWMASSVDLLRIFYQQRLGPRFTEIPVIEIPRARYLELLNGNDAILADIFAFSPELLMDIAIVFTKTSRTNDTVKVSMNLESESAGEKMIEFLESYQTYPLHNQFREALQILAERVQVLHYTWQRDRVDLPPFGLHRILIPKAAKAIMDKTKKLAAEAQASFESP